MADADAASVRLSSDSKADLSDPEKPGDDAASLSADAEDGRPWWKRVLASGADGAHTTQRAMRSRHLMMIGMSAHALWLVDRPCSRSHSDRRDHRHGHLPQCGLGEHRARPSCVPSVYIIAPPPSPFRLSRRQVQGAHSSPTSSWASSAMAWSFLCEHSLSRIPMRRFLMGRV